MEKKVSIHGIVPLPLERLTKGYIIDVKQKLLLFDTIGISHPEDALENFRKRGDKQTYEELKVLIDKGHIFNSVDLSSKSMIAAEVQSGREAVFQKVKENLLGKNVKHPERGIEFRELTNIILEGNLTNQLRSELQARMMSILWNTRTFNLKTEEFLPLLSMSVLPKFDKPKIDVYNILFNNIPIMHPDTPIEHILEFKDDENNKSRLIQLRVFLNKLANEGLSEVEIQQEIEHLMLQYQKSMSLHKIYSVSGLLNVSLNFAINAVYTTMGALGALMNIKINNVNLAASEMSYPGREVSYLYNAGKILGPQK